ncbi:MAG TPA: alpha-glucuronidase family glycosyl hydrolase [Acidobacteriaceae bacterium]|jgi:alpha-glucuronidase|nr:alpha-glucuronidase family glycosyl hydrolase [Acidobacteriaceae bacterium]
MRERISRRAIRALVLLVVATLSASALPLLAEDGSQAWLRYAPPSRAGIPPTYQAMPAAVVNLDSSIVSSSARNELIRGVRDLLGRTLRIEASANLADENAWVLGTTQELHADFPGYRAPALRPEGFSISVLTVRGRTFWVIAGADARGVLYGTFHVLSGIARGVSFTSLEGTESPAAPIRWVDQWDNLNGTIERGYAGRSIFFDDGHVRGDLTRAGDYARLLASIGINGCTINNVNADPRILQPEIIEAVARIADAFRPWGVRLAISVPISAPKDTGGLDTFDPGDPKVAAWWRAKADAIYAAIPDFAGFVVKADSEGQPGPSSYERTPADAANMLASALKPHGGIVLYRAFVYNHHLDWHDLKADRARAAYDIFHPLDGKFADNVVVQIKNGPIDFQVREPVSPLFGGLTKTNDAVELQITQEYTGQQRQLVYLPAMWETYLDFDLRAENRATPLKDIVDGQTFHLPQGGFVGVANVGLDANWLGSPLAMANLYGFGRLAWNPNTTAAAIASDWTRLTFSNNEKVVATVTHLLLESWPTYEKYTGPLGLQTLTNITGPHYGPAPQSQEENGWGQWIRAQKDGVGMDRTPATGTGFIGQYPPEVARMYESLKTCPDDLLLFMHHVPWTYRLRNGKTVIQTIYDDHYAGAQEADDFTVQWKLLNGLVDEQRYQKTLAMLTYQAGEAIVWRDAVTRWFAKISAVPDALGRVDHDPNRITASQMGLDGYTPVKVTPWETASGGKAYVCQGHTVCAASAQVHRPVGWYTVAIQYFDYLHGASTFRLLLNRQPIAAWTAGNSLPGDAPNGDTSTRYTLQGVPLRPGDVLTVEGHPEGGEPAPIDYLEIVAENPTSAKTRPPSGTRVNKSP